MQLTLVIRDLNRRLPANYLVNHVSYSFTICQRFIKNIIKMRVAYHNLQSAARIDLQKAIGGLQIPVLNLGVLKSRIQVLKRLNYGP